MVDKARLFERLMATFLDELDQHVRTINDNLLVLEKQQTPQARATAMNGLFRAVHSLKGAARAVEQSPIEQVCHGVEEVFTAIQDDRVAASPNLLSVVFSAIDAVENAGGRLRRDRTLDAAALEQHLPRLEAAAAGNDVVGSVPSFGQDQSEPDVADDSGTADPATESRHKTLTGSVRVPEEKLDSLLAQSGELLIARQRVEGRPDDLEPLSDLVAAWKADWQSVERTIRTLVEKQGDDALLKRSARLARHLADVVERNGQNLRRLEKQLDRFRHDLVTDARQLGYASRSLQDDVHRIRMFPFAEACAGLDRAVRDLCAATGKQVELFVEGDDIELDRTVLERLSDPLLHLVRNAIDHGMESPDDRRSAQKNECGQIRITASLRGSQVQIVVADDGRGLDLARIRQKVRDRGLPEPDDDRELARSIFLPGFSTADRITSVSGRGVGMDVVRDHLASLRGTIDISSDPGLGTRFTLNVPLTLTTINAVFVRSGDQTYALPGTSVTKLVRFRTTDIRTAHGRDVLSIDGNLLPLASLGRTLGVDRDEAYCDGMYQAVVVTTGNRDVVFFVDEIVREGEAVVKNLGRRIRQVRFVTGAVIERTGDVSLVLNMPAVVDAVSRQRTVRERTSPAPAASPVHRHRILVVDDSATTRTLLKSILDAAGYDVLTAVDGEDAWDRLQDSDASMVVTDVDMPNLDGFELTKRLRKSDRFERMPVVLVTARETDDDKARGVQSGANAYVVKAGFDQTDLLQTIEQLF